MYLYQSLLQSWTSWPSWQPQWCTWSHPLPSQSHFLHPSIHLYLSIYFLSSSHCPLPPYRLQLYPPSPPPFLLSPLHLPSPDSWPSVAPLPALPQPLSPKVKVQRCEIQRCSNSIGNSPIESNSIGKSPAQIFQLGAAYSAIIVAAQKSRQLDSYNLEFSKWWEWIQIWLCDLCKMIRRHTTLPLSV